MASAMKTVKSGGFFGATEEKTRMKRRRHVMFLIWDFLQQLGFANTCESLEKEVNMDLNEFAVCDNVDLETILQDFESFYYVRFQKYPQILRKLPEDDGYAQSKYKYGCSRASLLVKTHSSKNPTNFAFNVDKKCKGRANSCISSISTAKVDDGETNVSKSPTKLGLEGHQINHGRSNQSKHSSNKQLSFDDDDADIKPLQSLNTYFPGGDELSDFADIIKRDMYQHNPNVKWDDIVGLENAKRIVKEAVVFPIKYPKLFTGILAPWKGLLLYGPPGTGKTLIAKAVASECNTTFFNVSASTIVSKWRGESEKLIRVLFELARFHAPSTIFLDELDSLMCQRNANGTNCEHEGSRRMKTELLIQLDGLARSNDLVFLLAASNMPWELDHAMLRRLEKRVLIDLPNEQARESMLQYFLPPTIGSDTGFKLTSELDYKFLAKKLEGYSGADIRLVAKEAAMQRVRNTIDLDEPIPEFTTSKLCVEGIKSSDVIAAIEKTKPSARQFYERYQLWQEEYGSM